MITQRKVGQLSSGEDVYYGPKLDRPSEGVFIITASTHPTSEFEWGWRLAISFLIKMNQRLCCVVCAAGRGMKQVIVILGVEQTTI